MKRIFVLGSLNCDFTMQCPRLPAQGETLPGGSFCLASGGKGANQAYACALLGPSVRVKLAGAVGEDLFGGMLLRNLAKAGVDVSCVKKTKTMTGSAVILVTEGDNRIVIDEGANGTVSEEDVLSLLEEAGEGDLFLTQLELPVPIVEFALRIAKGKGMFTCLNPAPAKLIGCLGDADLITPNRSELSALAKEEDIAVSCSRLLDMGARNIVVTLGEEGSLFVSREDRFSCPAVKCGETVDTTAAGDTFCAALAVKLAEGAKMRDALPFASLCAGIAVTRRGAQPSVPTRAEAEELLRSLS